MLKIHSELLRQRTHLDAVIKMWCQQHPQIAWVSLQGAEVQGTAWKSSRCKQDSVILSWLTASYNTPSWSNFSFIYSFTKSFTWLVLRSAQIPLLIKADILKKDIIKEILILKSRHWSQTKHKRTGKHTVTCSIVLKNAIMLERPRSNKSHSDLHSFDSVMYW